MANGFALIVTISLMVLLTLLAVGLLSLSTLTLRSSNNSVAMSEARANARMALTIAIGNLQKHAGSDTRVTAPADIVVENSPPATGVWRSWEGTDHETRGRFAGRPIAPDYDSKRQSVTSNGRFISWLVSGTETGVDVDEVGSILRTVSFQDSIALVSKGTLSGDDTREVHLKPVELDSGGGMAWWVSGENQKARLPVPYEASADRAAQWSVMAKSHAVSDPAPFGLDALLDDASRAEFAVTRDSADLLVEDDGEIQPGDHFHDLSVASVGLLTNTATGGWRKDLSLLTESWTEQRKSGLALFQLNPGQHTQATIPTNGDPVPNGSMLYPWATYRGGSNNIPIYQHGPVTSWANLFDFATHYKRVSSSSSGRVTSPRHSIAIDTRSENFDFLHRVRILPVIARMQWVFSHSAAPIAGQRLLEPRLLLTPVITMWNPYNVEITSPPTIDFRIPKAMPAALRYTIGSQQNPGYNSVMAGVSNGPSLGGGSVSFRISGAFNLKPGETRLFSPASTTPVADNANLTLAPGYRSGGGHYYRVKGPTGQPLALPSSTTIKADAKFDTQEDDRAIGVGMYLDMAVEGRRHLVYRMVYTPEVANVVYPPLRNLASATLGQAVSNPQPFLSTIFGARTASNTHLAAKGFVQSSPLVNYTAMGRKDEVESTITRHYGGTAHPVNSPFDYSFVKHAPGGDSQLPNASDRTNRGYIVTGFNKADGLSRCVAVELPIRPLVSLAELTHWDLRYENPIPPYAINLIGNSDASPLLPSDAVVNSRDSGLTENLQYDDSYCANHLLFDDWFVSSIAPDPNLFGSSGGNQQKTYVGFVSGEEPLANRAYQPILEDRATVSQGSGGANQLYRDHIDPADSWRTIASRLEVEGMFNVNSTSVKAWRALLGHARNQRIAHIEETGASWKAGLSDETDHALSRFSVAGDGEAGTPGSSGAFPEATEFAGYRTVDEEFLDAMAEEVVRQVRMRGPFLSLSEFVNRQLSYGDVALAGTIQAALNTLAEDPATDPYGSLKALSTVSEANPPNPRGAAYDEEYQFPDAGAGHSAYGLPGWTRQADILRPLAPILTARDDTFTIRAHGDARDSQGEIIARAVCEAVVRRTRNFVDPAEKSDITTVPTRAINRTFGRQFEIVAFRWLTPDEV